MKTPLILTCIIAGAITMVTYCGCSNNHEYARFEAKSPAFDITFDYVSGWDHAEQRGSRGSFVQASLYEPVASKKKIRANMVVTVEPAAKAKIEPATIEAYAQGIISRRMNFKDTKLISQKGTKCAGLPAVELVLGYQLLDNPEVLNAVYVPARERIVIFKRNDAFYVLRYVNDINYFNLFAKAFEHMLASIRFKTSG
jgi:hypothetical protein